MSEDEFTLVQSRQSRRREAEKQREEWRHRLYAHLPYAEERCIKDRDGALTYNAIRSHQPPPTFDALARALLFTPRRLNYALDIVLEEHVLYFKDEHDEWRVRAR